MDGKPVLFRGCVPVRPAPSRRSPPRYRVEGELTRRISFTVAGRVTAGVATPSSSRPPMIIRSIHAQTHKS